MYICSNMLKVVFPKDSFIQIHLLEQ